MDFEFVEKEDKSDSLFHRVKSGTEDNLRSRIFKAENTIMYHSGMIESHERRLTRLEQK